MARTKDPHAATMKAWESRPRAGEGTNPTASRGDYAEPPRPKFTTEAFLAKEEEFRREGFLRRGFTEAEIKMGQGIGGVHLTGQRSMDYIHASFDVSKEASARTREHFYGKPPKPAVDLNDHAPRGEPDVDVRRVDGTLADERGGAPPKPGEPFVIYRLGRKGNDKLEGNAGNAEGVAVHMDKVAQHSMDYTGREVGHGDVVHAFRVVIDQPLGEFSQMGGMDQLSGGGAPGRMVLYEKDGRAGVWYSFSEGPHYIATKIGEVPVSEIGRRLAELGNHPGGKEEARKSSGVMNAFYAGTDATADAIRDAFATKG